MTRTAGKPTMDQVVESERLCLMERGAPIFLNQKQIREYFGINDRDVARMMAGKTPVIAGRYTLADVLYAIHGC